MDIFLVPRVKVLEVVLGNSETVVSGINLAFLQATTTTPKVSHTMYDMRLKNWKVTHKLKLVTNGYIKPTNIDLVRSLHLHFSFFVPVFANHLRSTSFLGFSCQLHSLLLRELLVHAWDPGTQWMLVGSLYQIKGLKKKYYDLLNWALYAYPNSLVGFGVGDPYDPMWLSKSAMNGAGLERVLAFRIPMLLYFVPVSYINKINLAPNKFCIIHSSPKRFLIAHLKPCMFTKLAIRDDLGCSTAKYMHFANPRIISITARAVILRTAMVAWLEVVWTQIWQSILIQNRNRCYLNYTTCQRHPNLSWSLLNNTHTASSWTWNRDQNL